MMHQAGQRQNSPQGDTISPNAVKNITATQAWDLMQNEKTILVDVRTEQELPDYGQPDITATGGESLLLPWRLAPDFEPNIHFLDELSKTASVSDSLLFLCKVGGRSHEAAITANAAGYEHSYNIVGGMDGENGWKASGLAWRNV